jgi:hypothetical protein
MPTREWMVNTQAFMDHVFSLSPGGGLAKCPCNKCQNCSRQVKIDMECHLCESGFMPNYKRWYEHGESQEQEAYNPVDSFEENEDRMDAMMDDFVELLRMLLRSQNILVCFRHQKNHYMWPQLYHSLLL